MALSLTPVAGYSGTGKVRTRRAKRVTTARFWPVFTIVCVKCIAQKAVKAPNYKCTLCFDRVSVGQEPACVKTCPTGAIHFGTKKEMLELGEQRVEKLKSARL